MIWKVNKILKNKIMKKIYLYNLIYIYNTDIDEK